MSDKKYLGEDAAQVIASGLNAVTPRVWRLYPDDPETLVINEVDDYTTEMRFPLPDAFRAALPDLKIGDIIDATEILFGDGPGSKAYFAINWYNAYQLDDGSMVYTGYATMMLAGANFTLAFSNEENGSCFVSMIAISKALEKFSSSVECGFNRDATGEYGCPDNWGVGTPFKNNPYGHGYIYLGGDNIAAKLRVGTVVHFPVNKTNDDTDRNYMDGLVISAGMIANTFHAVVAGSLRFYSPGSDSETKTTPGLWELIGASSNHMAFGNFYPLLNIWEDIYAMKSDIATHADAIKVLTPKKKFRGQIYMPEYRKLSDEDKIRVATINGRVVDISPTGYFEMEVADDEVINPLNVFMVTSTNRLLRNIDELPNTHLLTNFNAVFRCSRLKKIETKGWDTSNVTNMCCAFCELEELVSLDVSSFDTSKVTTMDSMFFRCRALTDFDVSGWDTSKVASMRRLFGDCNNLLRINLSGWDTSHLTEMGHMFNGCTSLTSLDLSMLDTSNVVYMGNMLRGCINLSYLLINGIDTGNVTDTREMFCECRSLISLDISSFDTSNVVLMNQMFAGCNKLRTLTLGVFDMSKANITGIFTNCNVLMTVTGKIVGIGQDISLASTGILTNESAMVFINGLAETDEPHTITFHKYVFNKLTPEQIAVATAKGWSVVSA